MPSVMAAAKLAATSSGAVSFAASTLSEASLSAAVQRSFVATRSATHAATTAAATAAPTTTFFDGMEEHKVQELAITAHCFCRQFDPKAMVDAVHCRSQLDRMLKWAKGQPWAKNSARIPERESSSDRADHH